MKKVASKILASVVMCALAFTLIACSNSGNDDPNIGKWVATEATYGGLTMDVKEISQDDIIIELKSGGKLTLTFQNQSSNGTWKIADDTITINVDGMTLIAIVDGDTMTVEDFGVDGVSVIFAKE